MNDKYFIDTNIFVYSFDATEKDKQLRSMELIKHALDTHLGCISYQVVQEFLNVATRKFTVPMSTKDAQLYLSTILEPLCEIFPNIELYHQALELSERWKYGFFDSLIIAAALRSTCKILYTEDLQHDQEIHNLRIINPFV